MGIATFIETAWGINAAKVLIYNAHWFELLFLVLAVSMVINLFRFRLFKKGKLYIGLFHFAFIFIVAGAAITRYFGFEGVVHIREEQSTNAIISSDTYLTVKTDDSEVSKKVLFSEVVSKKFDETISVNGQSVRIKSVGYITNAVRTPVEHESGNPMIDLVVSTDGGMQSVTFSEGDAIYLDDIILGFGEGSDIQLTQEGDSLYVQSDIELEIRTMGGETTELKEAGIRYKAEEMTLYGFGDNFFLVRQFYPHALIRVSKDTSGASSEDAVILQVSDGQKTSTVNVFGSGGVVGRPTNFQLGDSEIQFSYGSNIIELPFQLHLNDFQLERYLGSNSPSSYASELTLVDDEKRVSRDVRVFMNNTLKYRGYRFYQSSYDQDEMGTVLSVNKDYWGTLITYIGYFLMTLGMILALLTRESYFQKLIRRLKKQTRVKVATILFLLLGISGTVSANEVSQAGIPALDKQLVTEFSELWVHGRDGRVEPMSTLSSEILRKVSRKSSFEGLSPDEVVLSMSLYSRLWQSVPMVKLDDHIAEQIGVDANFASVLDFFDGEGQYKIQTEVQAAYSKTPALRTQLEKDYLTADERLNICFMVYEGSYFTVFPPSSEGGAWYATGSTPEGYLAEDSLFVNSSLDLLKQSMGQDAQLQPLEIISAISVFQQKYGAEVLPGESKKSFEIIYNKIKPFKLIFPVYLGLGFILLVILFVNIFRLKQMRSSLKRVFSILITATFLFHTGGLILRWYVSGHAPWSNGYESMVYVAWAAMLSGIIFGRKYPMVLGTAAFLSGLTLFVAHLNWVNPEITNLVPVLKSYWLLLHVAIITASYGFIGLSAVLGLLVMILYAMMKEHNRKMINHFVDQLTTISEMSVILGLYMLTVGTFLGGIWANESWGRYWGWDPKETWALVTVVVYAFIAHMRMIPSLKDKFSYNLATVIGFTSVIMTYFGVNYFLSGLHSYGSGSIDSVPWGVYVVVLAVIALILYSNSKYKKFELAEDTGDFD